ncbi:MAG: hypothetical protein FJX74_20235 [Armatimonadetes bacterium]|nr:hypothetical protein [Armatimonadota bacterium]
MAADARAFMVDLGFSNPFAPYELEFRQTDLTGALQKVGRALGLDEAMVDRLRAVQRQVGDSARPASWRSVALV